MLPRGPSGSVIPTLKFIRAPRKMLEQWRQSYGDPFLLHALNGPIVMTGRAELIREIFGADPSVFDQFAQQTILPVLGPGSILSMVGDAHRRERKLLMPMFHGDCMRSYGHDMCETARQRIEHYLPCGQVEILPLMTEISFAVIVKNIIGGSNAEELRELIAASEAFVQSVKPILLFTRKSHRSFWGLSPWDKFLKAKRHMHDLINRIIADRRLAADTHDDILSLLCRSTYDDGQPLSDDHIRDELLTFLFAGHETTALSLTWAMFHLHRNPQTLAKLQEELNHTQLHPDSLANAPYLKACIQETLRIHPIITEVVRKLNQPLPLAEFTIPAGYAVSAVTVLAHYDPQTYPNPDQFDPDRFVGKSYSPFNYMPFGGGHRRCVGAAFAAYEMAMVLGTLLREYQFTLRDQREVVPVRRNVTMAPSSNVSMQVARRAVPGQVRV